MDLERSGIGVVSVAIAQSEHRATRDREHYHALTLAGYE
jgi:hypothetical protein